MRIGISNIAWDIAEDEQIASILQKHGLDAIDIAPGKYFPVLGETSMESILKIRRWWENKGIEITGMQALLFGTQGLNVFGSEKVQNALLNHLTEVCRIGGALGAHRLTFGSPKNRDRTGLDDENTLKTAVSFFRKLGDVANRYNTIFCLETNPVCYGANFMTTDEETLKVVKAVDHPCIKMQLDLGALAINGDDINVLLGKESSAIGHIHASEPDLLPFGDSGFNYDEVSMSIKKALPNHVVCVEMLATKKESHVISVNRALMEAIKIFNKN